mgnify:CR=1 FL=1
MNTVPALYAEGLRYVGAQDWCVDFSQVSNFDSSSVSLVLAWMRAAQHKNTQLTVSGLPANLRSLASLYGVEEFLPT